MVSKKVVLTEPQLQLLDSHVARAAERLSARNPRLPREDLCHLVSRESGLSFLKETGMLEKVDESDVASVVLLDTSLFGAFARLDRGEPLHRNELSQLCDWHRLFLERIRDIRLAKGTNSGRSFERVKDSIRRLDDFSRGLHAGNFEALDPQRLLLKTLRNDVIWFRRDCLGWTAASNVANVLSKARLSFEKLRRPP